MSGYCLPSPSQRPAACITMMSKRTLAILLFVAAASLAAMAPRPASAGRLLSDSTPIDCPLCIVGCTAGSHCECGQCVLDPEAPAYPPPSPGCKPCTQQCKDGYYCSCGRCVQDLPPPPAPPPLSANCTPCTQMIELLCPSGLHCECGSCVPDPATPSPSTACLPNPSCCPDNTICYPCDPTTGAPCPDYCSCVPAVQSAPCDTYDPCCSTPGGTEACDPRPLRPPHIYCPCNDYLT